MSTLPKFLQDLNATFVHAPILDLRAYTAGKTPIASPTDNVTGTMENFQEPFGAKEVVAGKYGVSFDGSDDRINLGTNIGDLSTNEFSVSMWASRRELNTNGYLISKRTDTNFGFFIAITSSGARMNFAVRNGSGGNFFWSISGWAINECKHIIATWKGDGGATDLDKIKMYINGQPVVLSQTTAGIAATLPDLTAASAMIGENNLAGSSLVLPGAEFNTIFANRAWSAAEALALYNRGPDFSGKVKATVYGPNGEYMDLKDKRRAGGGSTTAIKMGIYL
jgi:hypothetical protein